MSNGKHSCDLLEFSTLCNEDDLNINEIKAIAKEIISSGGLGVVMEKIIDSCSKKNEKLFEVLIDAIPKNISNDSISYLYEIVFSENSFGYEKLNNKFEDVKPLNVYFEAAYYNQLKHLEPGLSQMDSEDFKKCIRYASVGFKGSDCVKALLKSKNFIFKDSYEKYQMIGEIISSTIKVKNHNILNDSLLLFASDKTIDIESLLEKYVYDMTLHMNDEKNEVDKNMFKMLCSYCNILRVGNIMNEHQKTGPLGDVFYEMYKIEKQKTMLKSKLVKTNKNQQTRLKKI